MGRKSTRGVFRERSDYTQLLSELQTHNAVSPSGETALTKKEKAKPPKISSFRQRLMSDERVLYFYKKSENELHDKTCPEARKISDDDLRWSETYLHHLRQCPLCQTKAYLRLGARDISRLSDYEKLFQQMRISPQLQRRMYVHEGMRTEYLGSGRLKIWGSEDTWLLEEIPGTDRLRLLHNNYRTLADGMRQFVTGYHEQSVCATAKYAVFVIAGYTYAGHKAAMERRQEALASTVETVNTPQTPPRPLNMWERFKRWLKALVEKSS